MATYQPHDRLYRRARARGLPSRAAFKLEELLERYRLVRPGGRVIDLGCAPGGWLAILGRAAGPGGRVIGVDPVACRAPGGGRSETVIGDLREPAVRARVAAMLGGRADLVTSDLAPKLSGIAERDAARMAELLGVALEFAAATLRPGGAMIAKIFMDAGFEALKARFRRHFDRVEVARTQASRPGSSELYLVARGLRPDAETGVNG
jgi:23S rRNA (uridine2552-2'-O)-methyltransferase